METLATLSSQLENLNETHQNISNFAADDDISHHTSTTKPVTSKDAAPVNDTHDTSYLASSMSTSTYATPASAAPKVSILAKTKLKFVIPKNKLSGALVPVTKISSRRDPVDSSKNELKQPSRKSKWGDDMTQDPFVKRGRALALQTRAEQLAAQIESGNMDVDNSELTRSPSPPPVYDILGHRINTREGRKREQLDFERREAIGECIKLNPSYKPPPGYKPILREAKLFIPTKDHPGYNFIGLILGPRGNTQKRMEAETGAKITICGKGALKDGKLSSRNRLDTDGPLEALHVHITADTFEKVDAAVSIIEPLLTPVHEDRNMHKMKQLRELAEMNGTARDLTKVCSVCGDMGHRDWQCPKDISPSFQAKVICECCGDGGHPTSDCPLKSTSEGKQMDKEYLNFLEELGAGLYGIDTSKNGSDNSQPMLLTASGAQPMPERWTGSVSGSESTSGADNNNGQPKFPFPFPPSPDGMNAINFLLSHLFHPVHGVFRGRPLPPPGHPIMARILTALQGRFPCPQFGPQCDIQIPSLATTSDCLVMENHCQTTINASLTGNLSIVKETQELQAASMPVPVSIPVPPAMFSVSVRPAVPSVRPVFVSVRPAIQQGQMPPVNNNPSQPWSMHQQSSIPLHIPPHPFPVINSPGVRLWGNTQGPGMVSTSQHLVIPGQFQQFTGNMITSPVPPRFPPVQVSQGQFAMTQTSINYNTYSGFPPGPSPPVPPSFCSQHTSASEQRFSFLLQGMPSHGPTFSAPDTFYVKSQYPVSAGSQRSFPPPNTQGPFRGPSLAPENPNQVNHHNFGPQGSVGIFPRQQLLNTFTPQPQETDPEYEKLMASVGVL